jgi:hypothetical protein
MLFMGISQIQDDTKRWFAIGFEYLWKTRGDADRFVRNMTGFLDEVSKKSGIEISPSTMSNLFRGRMASFPGDRKRMALAKYYDLTADEVVALGREKEMGRNNNVLQLEHRNIIRLFENQEIAYQLNKKLIELERLSGDALYLILEHVEQNINNLQTGGAAKTHDPLDTESSRQQVDAEDQMEVDIVVIKELVARLEALSAENALLKERLKRYETHPPLNGEKNGSP